MASTGVTTGFLLIDKPAGWTSHDVVAKVRGMFQQKKVGHAGTLDPMATGLLVIGLGKATRLLRFVQGGVKEYVATAQFGVATDSLDADGSVIARESMPVTEAEVVEAAARFVGDIHQVPPMVSAKKVDGRRLYEIARAGEEVERAAVPVTVHHLEITDFAPSDYPVVSFNVRCSTGTYIRSLADDLAAALGGRAHLTQLRRVANGNLSVADAVTMDELQRRTDNGSHGGLVLAPADALADMPAIELEARSVRAVSNGVSFPRSAFPGVEGTVRMLSPGGDLVAVYRAEGPRLGAEVVLG